MKRFFKQYGTAYAFLLPWMCGILCFTLIPIVLSLYYSFTNYDLFRAPQWVGVDNYVRMFTQDIKYLQSIKVTLTYVFIGVPLKLMFALFLALALNRGMRGLAFFRAVYYVPSLLGGSVAISVLWKNIFGRDGIINRVLQTFGISATTSWIGNPQYSLGTLIILLIWQFGSSMIIFLAGLKQIPQDLYEAAEIDGAGKWKQFVKITLPMLSPIILFNLIMQFISAFQAFTPAFIIGGLEGSPLQSLLFYTLYLYTTGFSRLQMGYASAMAWVLLVFIGALTGIAFYTSKHWVFYDS